MKLRTKSVKPAQLIALFAAGGLLVLLGCGCGTRNDRDAESVASSTSSQPRSDLISSSTSRSGSVPTSSTTSRPRSDLTFNKDIAPIIFTNCATCHHAGGVAPFSLTDYGAVQSRAREIKAVTSSRFMPPWKAQRGWGEFENARSLSDDEIATIAAWVDNGAPKGDGEPPPLPDLSATSYDAWQLGKPDLIVKMDKPFSIPADGPDINRCFVIPLGLTKDTYVRACEVHPSNRAVMHHCVLFLDTSGNARKLDAMDEGMGYPVFSDPGFVPDGGLGLWTVGFLERPLPPGVARLIKRGTDLVLHAHFHPTGKPETEQTTIGLYFAKDKIEHRLTRVTITKLDISIAPGARAYQAWAHCVLPVDVRVIGLAPHSHYLCKEIKAWATPPDGKKEKLIYVRDWDFNWQTYFRYKTPVSLKGGTKVEAVYYFDNTAGNPKNPNSPPLRVFFGPRTVDEMPLFWLDVVAENESERPKLLEMLRGRQFVYNASW